METKRKLEKDKNLLEFIPDVGEPLSKKSQKTVNEEASSELKKIEMAQFFPEPGVLVEIPFDSVKTLYTIKMLLYQSNNPESTQKMIDRAKQRCLDHVTRQHPETSNILDDIKKLEKIIEAAQMKIKLAAASVSGKTTAATSAAVSKKEVEKSTAERLKKERDKKRPGILADDVRRVTPDRQT